MKRWQSKLLRVVLLTLALALFMRLEALLLVPILWFLTRKVSAAGERPLKATVRFVVASFAAVGFSVLTQATQALPFLKMQELFFQVGPISFVALSCLLIYWLEDTYAQVSLEGVGRTILRAVMSLLLASLAAIGFGIALLYAFVLIADPGPTNFGWTAWGLLSLSFVLQFYATWKLLPQNVHR